MIHHVFRSAVLFAIVVSLSLPTTSIGQPRGIEGVWIAPGTQALTIHKQDGIYVVRSEGATFAGPLRENQIKIGGVCGDLTYLSSENKIIFCGKMFTQDLYLVKAKLSEVILAAATCRTAVTEIYKSAVAASIECGTNGSRYVKSVVVDKDGRITTAVQGIDPQVDGKVLVLAPFGADNRPIKYKKGTSSIVAGWVCGASGTTIPREHLPMSCQGE